MHDLLAEFITEVDGMIKVEASQLEDALLLTSIPGISYYSTLLIGSEIGEILRFQDARRLLSYAGLVPSTLGSGGKVFSGRITKQGSKWLRWIMVRDSLVICRCGPALSAYNKKIAERKGYLLRPSPFPGRC